MRRLALNLIMLLLLGAVTTVAVAWGCALWIDPWEGSKREAWYGNGILELEEDAGYYVAGFATTGVERYMAEWSSHPAWLSPEWLQRESISGEEPPPAWTGRVVERYALVAPDSNSMFIDCRGWPLVALQFHGEQQTGAVIGGLRLPSSVRGSGLRPELRALPLIPIWVGFAGDTSIYALAYGALAALWLRLRRLGRLRRGRCPQCAYEMRGDYARRCPECGWQRKEGASACSDSAP